VNASVSSLTTATSLVRAPCATIVPGSSRRLISTMRMDAGA
jgi:hypothetical protein